MYRSSVVRVAAVCSIMIAGLLAAQSASATQTASTITRTYDPVIVTGNALPSFRNVALSKLFVYTYNATTSTWAQIPYQIDERDPQEVLTANDNGVLDDRDEVVFMAKDLGDAANGAKPSKSDSTLIGSAWYEISVRDPLNPTASGYAYVVQSSSAQPSFTGDYARFDATNRRMVGQNYEIGWPIGKSYFDYMVVNGGLNLLDRGPKIRACAGALCLTEDSPFINGTPWELIKDGPVRVIAHGGGEVIGTDLLAYRNTFKAIARITTPVRPDFIRFSFDFNINAGRSLAYNAFVGPGDTVDGLGPQTLDDNSVGPYENSWQLSTATGALINVGDVSALGGQAKTYYVDNGTCGTPCTDTGDQKHIGESGVRVDNSATAFTYPYEFYFVDGRQAQIRSTYASYFSSPVTSTTTFFQETIPGSKVYLPLVRK